MIQVLLSSFLYRNLPRVTELVDPGVGFQPITWAQVQLTFYQGPNNNGPLILNNNVSKKKKIAIASPTPAS